MNTLKLSQARERQAQGDLKGALELYEELLSESPKNAEILHIIGVLYAQLNEPAHALNYLNNAIREEPTAALYNSLGNVFRRMHKFDDATQAFQKALTLEPEYPAAYNNLGLIYYQQGHFENAQKAYEKAISLAPHFVDALLNAAILDAHLGELSASQKKLEQAYQLNPDNPKILGQLAQVYLNQGNYQKALLFFDEKLKRLPEDSDTFYDIGLCLLKSEQFSDAIKSFETALTLKSEAQDLYHHLATAYLYSQDPEKALNYYFRQLEIEPLMESYYNIGVLLMNKNRAKEAISYLEYAATIEPDYFPTHINLGALYLKQQNLQKAIAHYQIAAHLRPDDVEIQHILAALQKDKTPDAAPKQYLQHLFDQYANFYDVHLTKHLRYQVPEKMYARISEALGSEQAFQILDLGCGTGLCGLLFRKMAMKLIGIDVSEKMLAQAKEKNIYDELAALDVTIALEKYRNNDIILAADVFTYIGNLSTIFEKAFQALNSKGVFAFSVEKTYAEPFELQHSIRYAHSKKYLESLIEKNHFDVLHFDNLILRKQNNKEVEGYLVLLQKP